MMNAKQARAKSIAVEEEKRAQAEATIKDFLDNTVEKAIEQATEKGNFSTSVIVPCMVYINGIAEKIRNEGYTAEVYRMESRIYIKW